MSLNKAQLSLHIFITLCSSLGRTRIANAFHALPCVRYKFQNTKCYINIKKKINYETIFLNIRFFKFCLNWSNILVRSFRLFFGGFVDLLLVDRGAPLQTNTQTACETVSTSAACRTHSSTHWPWFCLSGCLSLRRRLKIGQGWTRCAPFVSRTHRPNDGPTTSEISPRHVLRKVRAPNTVQTLN